MDFSSFLDSRLRGNDRQDPSPSGAFGTAGLSTARGEAGCFIRLKCYENVTQRTVGLPLSVTQRLTVIL